MSFQRKNQFFPVKKHLIFTYFYPISPTMTKMTDPKQYTDGYHARVAGMLTDETLETKVFDQRWKYFIHKAEIDKDFANGIRPLMQNLYKYVADPKLLYRVKETQHSDEHLFKVAQRMEKMAAACPPEAQQTIYDICLQTIETVSPQNAYFRARDIPGFIKQEDSPYLRQRARRNALEN
jgi:hypothetical protein